MHMLVYTKIQGYDSLPRAIGRITQVTMVLNAAQRVGVVKSWNQNKSIFFCAEKRAKIKLF